MTPKLFAITNRHSTRQLAFDGEGRVTRDGTDNALFFMTGWPLDAVQSYCARRHWTLEEISDNNSA